MLDSELVERAPDRVVDHVVERPEACVEGRHGRRDDRTGLRESPLSVIHLENMLRVAKAGAVVAPPVPAFYAKLHSLDEMVDHTVGRALDQLGVEHERIRRWGERRAALRAVRPDEA